MLLAIDVGNTHTVFGLWDGASWRAVWRRPTDPEETEDGLAVWLRALFDLEGLDWRIERVICASVVPAAEDSLRRLGERWLKVPVQFLRSGAEVGLAVDYEPATAVGPDRICDVLAALERYTPPLIVVDFGTATTFNAVSGAGVYLGGAIMTGVVVSAQALASRASKLPLVEFKAPDRAIGTNTGEALRSGVMLGYAGAVDALARRISHELGGGVTVVATGGLGGMFLGLCESLQGYEPTLTLDGLVLASKRISPLVSG